ncbi:nucleotidyltransferase [Rhodopseudomonas palustris]|uniref:nucleotidyltransferase domain-containing protein n=1 Tax=Rhodopseudomonas palustris TaxID=1076 RepID=UPI002ACD6E30|nr:nucleotidyltransferase [Rhodopseudomonas palustris]WQH00895.1 nucleotidyltransferase [Rhodopseudomonas palustris]
MNVLSQGPWPTLSDYDALLMDVARRIQLTKTKHEIAETNFRALCQYVDREGSPLENKVIECYPSGSFATGTAIASRVAKAQHDVDVVMELDVPPNSPPRDIISLLFLAINGEEGSRYYGKVTQNSRCVTVEYGDGTTVDLMPIARIAGPERAGNLFHFKRETGETHHKPVNPWGFAKYFNDHVDFDPAFYDLFKGRRLLVEGQIVEKAETQPMPNHVPVEEKSARVVALQLLKRNRDIVWRAPNRTGRKPPSVALAAMALDAGTVHASLLDEVIAIASHIRSRLVESDGPRGTVQVFNPAYPPDEFTDRWPENEAAQELYDGDLRRLIVNLYKLRNENFSLAEQQEVLERLFGETAATYAIESTLDARLREMDANRLHLGSTGKVLGAAAAAVGGTTAARAATREGGGELSE